MPKKTSKQLDADIDAYLRGEKSGPREAHPAPRYNAKKGGWTGGDRRTLYLFSGPGGAVIHPGCAGTLGMINEGPGADVRVATKAEAERHWQSPLHSGWNVAP